MIKSLSVCIITANRKDYLKRCLNSVADQNYDLKEVIVVDNGSIDDTILMLKNDFPQVIIIANNQNFGPCRARNQAIKKSQADFILCLDDDAVLNKDYCQKAMEIFDKYQQAGSVQGKILQYNKSDFLDTVGFKIFKSRRLIDLGKGQKDIGQYDTIKEIFAANSVAVVFNKKALEEIKIYNEYFDEDFFKVAEDPDIGWRLRLYGWKNYYQPEAKAWHNSHSSKKLSRNYFDFIQHRKSQPAELRKLDWRNQHLMFVKNDSAGLLAKDALYIFWREFKFFIYLIFFEWGTLKGIYEFFRLLPKILKKRKIIMSRKKINFKEISKYFA